MAQVCGESVCVHELVFADVCGGIQTCNCVCIQAPTAASVATVDAEQYKALEAKVHKQTEEFQRISREKGQLTEKYNELQDANQGLKEAHEGLQAAHVALQAANGV